MARKRSFAAALPVSAAANLHHPHGRWRQSRMAFAKRVKSGISRCSHHRHKTKRGASSSTTSLPSPVENVAASGATALPFAISIARTTPPHFSTSAAKPPTELPKAIGGCKPCLRRQCLCATCRLNQPLPASACGPCLPTARMSAGKVPSIWRAESFWSARRSSATERCIVARLSQIASS